MTIILAVIAGFFARTWWIALLFGVLAALVGEVFDAWSITQALDMPIGVYPLRSILLSAAESTPTAMVIALAGFIARRVARPL